MNTTVTVTIGMKQEEEVSATFIARFLAAALDQIEECERADWNVYEDGDAGDLVISSHTGGTLRSRRVTAASFFAGLTEWAEQALLYIEDTYAHWMHNALAVSASSWHRIDVDADDWAHLVALYIADNYGTDI
jgi:hypothetical protein